MYLVYKLFYYVTPDCTPETFGQCVVILLWSLDSMHLIDLFFVHVLFLLQLYG